MPGSLGPADAALRVILIGGTSHTGKSTLAGALAGHLGWTAVSTDTLARHPGRPWGPIPPQVIQHYEKLDVTQLLRSVFDHYEKMAPSIERLVTKHLDEGEPRLVLEGSALLPETLLRLKRLGVGAILLTATPALLESRIRTESDYAGRDKREKSLIDTFIARALAFDKEVVGRAAVCGIPVLAVTGAADSLVDLLLKTLRSETRT